MLGARADFDLDGEVPLLNGTVVSGWIDSQVWQLVCREQGLKLTKELSDALNDEYADRYQALLASGVHPGTLLPGVHTALRALAAGGVRVALTTGNAHRIAAAKMAALGLGGWFTFDADAGFGDWRSDRTALVPAALAALNTRAGERAALVGDTSKDMLAANTHGLVAVGVTTGACDAAALRAAGAALILDSLVELAPALGIAPLAETAAGALAPQGRDGLDRPADAMHYRMDFGTRSD